MQDVLQYLGRVSLAVPALSHSGRQEEKPVSIVTARQGAHPQQLAESAQSQWIGIIHSVVVILLWCLLHRRRLAILIYARLCANEFLTCLPLHCHCIRLPYA